MKKGIVSTALTAVIAGGLGAAAAAASMKTVDDYAIEKAKKSRDKFKSYYDVVREWMGLSLKGKKVKDYLDQHGYQKIAVYGAGTMGDLFAEEMGENSGMISCFIEQTGVPIENFIGNIPMTSLEYEVDFSDIDAVVVTAITYFGDIQKDLLEKGCQVDIISLEDIIYELQAQEN